MDVWEQKLVDTLYMHKQLFNKINTYVICIFLKMVFLYLKGMGTESAIL